MEIRKNIFILTICYILQLYVGLANASAKVPGLHTVKFNDAGITMFEIKRDAELFTQFILAQFMEAPKIVRIKGGINTKLGQFICEKQNQQIYCYISLEDIKKSVLKQAIPIFKRTQGIAVTTRFTESTIDAFQVAKTVDDLPAGLAYTLITVSKENVSIDIAINYIK